MQRKAEAKFSEELITLQKRLDYLNYQYPALFLVLTLFILADLCLDNNAWNTALILIVIIFYVFVAQNSQTEFFYFALGILVYTILIIKLKQTKQFLLLEHMPSNYMGAADYDMLIKNISYKFHEDKYFLYAELVSGNCKGLKLYITSQNEALLKFAPGDIISVRVKPAIINEAAIPGQFSEAKWLTTENVYFKFIIPERTKIKLLGRKYFPYFVFRPFAKIKASLTNNFLTFAGQDAAGLLPTMLYGDKTYLNKTYTKLFRDLGISHVLVASGTNVTLFLNWLKPSLRKLTVKISQNRKSQENLAEILEIFALLFLACLAPGEIAITRAIIMKILEIISRARLHYSHKINYMLLSVLILGIFDPYVYTKLSLKLSCLASLAIYSFKAVDKAETANSEITGVEQIRKFSKFVPRKCSHSTNSSQVAETILKLYNYFRVVQQKLNAKLRLYLRIQLFVLPALWASDSYLSLRRILCNVFLLPITEIILFWALLFALFSWLDFLAPLLGTALRGIMDFFLNLLFYVEANFNLTVQVKRAYLLLLIYLPWRKIIKLKPESLSELGQKSGKWSRSKIFLQKTIVVFSLSICVYVANVSRQGIYFVDVGQGDCTLIWNGESTVLIDTGNKGKTQNLLTTLDYLELKQIDYLFVTHLDSDHIAGLEDLFQQGIKVKTILLSPYVKNEQEKYQKFIEIVAAAKSKVNLIEIRAGDCLETNKCKYLILGPIVDKSENNNNSLLILGNYGDKKILWPGDIDAQMEAEYSAIYPELKLDIFHLAHHGSNHANSKAFLEKLDPSAAVSSSGFFNKYGHPSKAVLNNLQELHIDLYRTDYAGTIYYNPRKGKFIKIMRQTYLPPQYDRIKQAIKEGQVNY